MLEYDWIEDWSCEVLYTASGVAEDGCIFRTRVAPGVQMTWVVTRYEAPWKIEFACVAPGSHVMRLKLELRLRHAGSTLIWNKEITATEPAGEAIIAHQVNGEHQTRTRLIEKMLKHYLSTGTMLRIAPAAVQAVE